MIIFCYCYIDYNICIWSIVKYHIIINKRLEEDVS